MDSTVARVGAWCDYVTDDEMRARVGADGMPSPGGQSFDVAEFVVLMDGRRVTLHQERGWTSWTHEMEGRAQLIEPWSSLTEASVRESVLAVVAPDDDDTDDEIHYEWLALLCTEVGIPVGPEELRSLDYEVEFSDRLRTRLVLAAN